MSEGTFTHIQINFLRQQIHDLELEVQALQDRNIYLRNENARLRENLGAQRT